MPDAESDTRACPYCKEEVKVAAVRCKHCLADIAPTRLDHGGVCPLCREDIKADAVRCKHCRATLVPGGRSVLARVRRPARITRRRPVDDPVELGGRRPSVLPVRDPASADRAGGGCPEFIETRYGTYHLVDEGIGADGWHYCGYEPGYGVRRHVRDPEVRRDGAWQGELHYAVDPTPSEEDDAYTADYEANLSGVN